MHKVLHKAAAARAGDSVNADACLFKHLQYSDLADASCCSAAQSDSYKPVAVFAFHIPYGFFLG